MALKKQIPSLAILQKAYELMYTAKAMTDVYEKYKDITSKYVHATSRGHEAIQIALGMQLEPQDWVAPYYRDDAMLLSMGMTAYDLMLQLMELLCENQYNHDILASAKRVACFRSPQFHT